jgi:hypothetical protein
MCWLILPPTKVIRNDGSIGESKSSLPAVDFWLTIPNACASVEIQAAATIKEEVHGMWLAMKRWEIWLLIPAFFASNYFYAYREA